LTPGINQINSMDIFLFSLSEKKELQTDEYDVRYKHKRHHSKTRTPYNHKTFQIDWGEVLFNLVFMVPLKLLEGSLQK